MAKFEFRKNKETASEVTDALRQEVAVGVSREALASFGIEEANEKHTPIELRKMKEEYERAADLFREMYLWAEKDSDGNQIDPFDKLGHEYTAAANVVMSHARPASRIPTKEVKDRRAENLVNLINVHEENDADSLNTYHVRYHNPKTGRRESRRPGYDEETGRIYTESYKEASNASVKRRIVQALRDIYTYKTETGML
ncbi:hypothetical protein GX865_02575 [Candidatus Saccharibacteria bacterium]|nr:hypothetical protein [Candidatus Saccharibacteria bacterium]